MKAETHVLQVGDHRITVRIQDRRPDDLPLVEIMTDPGMDYKDARLVPWMGRVLRPYGPYLRTTFQGCPV